MGANEEADEEARLSIERYREPVGRYNEYIESNPASISNDYTDLYSDYVASIPNTNCILLTIQ